MLSADIYRGDQYQIVPGLLTDDESNAPYALSNHEMIHYVHATACMQSHRARAGRGANAKLTTDDAHHIVLDMFKAHWLREVEGAQCTM